MCMCSTVCLEALTQIRIFLLNLLNKLRKRDKMQGFACILLLSRSVFRGPGMLDSIYHLTLKLL